MSEGQSTIELAMNGMAMEKHGYNRGELGRYATNE